MGPYRGGVLELNQGASPALTVNLAIETFPQHHLLSVKVNPVCHLVLPEKLYPFSHDFIDFVEIIL